MIRVGVLSAVGAVLLLTTPVQANSFSAGRGLANWDGLYIGAHVGGAWGNMDVVDTDGGVPYGAFSYSPSGAFGGGTLGYNVQINNIVVGIEGDLGYMDLTGDKVIASSSPNYHQDLKVDGGMYGDIAGRLGFAFGRTLVYGKGGFAFFDGRAIQATTKTWYTPTGTEPSPAGPTAAASNMLWAMAGASR